VRRATSESASVLARRPAPSCFSCRLFRNTVVHSFFRHCISWARLRANSCARQLRGFCFPASSRNPLASLPECSRSPWEQRPSLWGASGKWGKKRRKTCTYMLSGITSGAVRSRTLPAFEHDLSSLATPGTQARDAAGGAFRPHRRGWQWRGGQQRSLGECRPNGSLANAAASAVCITSDSPVIQQFLRLIRTSRLVEAYRRKAPDSSKGSAPATFTPK
jgi:hypothetical protein